MHLKIDKKFNYLIYGLIILFLTSINNYNFYNRKIFNINIVEVTGFSVKKTPSLKMKLKIFKARTFFLLKRIILKNLLIEMIQKI